MNFGGNSYGPIIGPYLFLGKFVWTNGPESSSKVSPYTGIGPWMAIPSKSPVGNFGGADCMLVIFSPRKEQPPPPQKKKHNEHMLATHPVPDDNLPKIVYVYYCLRNNCPINSSNLFLL